MFFVSVGLKSFITSLKNLFNPTRRSNTSHKTNYLSFFSLLNQTLNFRNWHLFCVSQNDVDKMNCPQLLCDNNRDNDDECDAKTFEDFEMDFEAFRNENDNLNDIDLEDNFLKSQLKFIVDGNRDKRRNNARWVINLLF